MSRLRLLHLGFAFPPGVAGHFPALNPAGHLFECRFIGALAEHVEVTSVGLLPREARPPLPPPDDSPGLPHALTLSEGDDGPLATWRTARQLRRWYQERTRAGQRFDAVLAYNLSPAYNHFVRWLRNQAGHPRLVLLLADSSTLGRPLPWLRRLRWRFKPFRTPDNEALRWFDAAIGLSRDTRCFFAPRGVPWHWMPGGAPAAAEVPEAPRPDAGAIEFAYFGALAEHAGVLPLVAAFVQAHVPGRLRICGYGRLASRLGELSAQHPRLVFDGLLPSLEDCVPWAQASDVLVNPRPGAWGNENNFPSKVFQYAETGRAILTTRLSGVDAVLGPAATVIEPEPLEENLTGALRQLANTSRAELRRRGAAIRQRVVLEYAWPRQAAGVAAFLDTVVRHNDAGGGPQPA